ncbi:MAG: hypothetical protein AcusKO_43380 [Acuticoccus sp.]
MIATSKRVSKWSAGVPRAILVGGSSLLAIVSASCCVLPIGLTILGLGGTWLTFLGPLVAHRTEILIVAALIVAVAWFWFFKVRQATGRYPKGLVLTFIATLSLGVAASAPLWEQE